MSAAIRAFLLLSVFVGIAELCGNIKTNTNDTAPARKRRSADGFSIAHIEFQTTLTNAGEADFSKIENEVTNEFDGLIEKAHRQIATGTDGGSVLKYMFTEVDCGTAQLFAQAVKQLTSFVTGGTVSCNGQTTRF